MKILHKIFLLLLAQYLIWIFPVAKSVVAQPAVDFFKSSYHSQLVNNEAENILSTIIPDFQVNENAGGSLKLTPAMGFDKNGNFVAGWSDSRDGYTRIYAQRFNRAGMPLGANFRVDGEAGSSRQYLGDVAVRENGDFVIVWLETVSTPERKRDVVARMFDGSGTALGASIKVTEEYNLSRYSPGIAIDTKGNFMIVWQESRLGERYIFAQRYDSTGSPLGYNFKVNDESGSTKQYPQIVATGDNRFLVAWQDRRSGNDDIYAQRYDSLGTTLGPNFLLIPSKGSITELSLAANSVGDVVIVWDEWQDADRDLYVQHFHHSDTVVANGYKVNDLVMSRGFFKAKVAITPRGDFCVTWHGDDDGHDVIFAKWYDRFGTARGAQKKANEKYSLASNSFPSVFVDNDGYYTLAWIDLRNGQPDIYAQQFDSLANALGTNFKMNDDVGSADQIAPDVSVTTDGNFVVVWADYREPSPFSIEGRSNIYAKRYDPAGAALGKDFKVNHESPGNYIWDPKVAMALSGQFMVVWNEGGSFGDIFAQFFSAKGTPVSANMLVSVDTGMVINEEHDIAVDANGNFVIVWKSSSNYFRGIYAQRYDSTGTPIGSSLKVTEQTSYSPAVATTTNSEFMVVWEGPGDITARLYNGAGMPQGTDFQVNSSGINPAVTADGNGNYFIVWINLLNSNWEINARRYDRSGNALGEKFKVNEVLIWDWQENLSVSSDQDGKILVAWKDYRQGYWNIMAQRYDNLGQRVGDNFCPTQHTSLDQEYPSTQVVNGKIYLAWQTNHVGGTGYDIWANMLDWSAPVDGVDYMNPAEPKNTFSLSQNYPNPFNQSTKIQYVVSEAGPATINIYNLAGSLVRTLVNKSPGAGVHEIIWDGNDIYGQVMASGIYFYQIKSGGHVATRRMVLLR